MKCSLLFLQKYTVEEKQTFDKTYAQAKTEIDEHYADEIAKQTERLESAIADAKENKDTEGRKTLQKSLRDYLKLMDAKKTAESRQLLKDRFDYPIFMYEAQKVGISATGEEDLNELYPTDNKPKDIEKTCLEWYREFLADPGKFVGNGEVE